MHEQLRRARQVYKKAPPAERQSAHDYLPDWLAPHVPKLREQEGEKDPVVWLKLFTPDSSWTWYVTEHEDGVCFGLVEGFVTEWGCFDLAEIAAARGPWGLRVERDLWFRPVLASQIPST